MDVPTDAIEAAAEAMLTFWSPLPDPTGIAWTALDEPDKEQLRTEARATITAAMPALCEAILTDVRQGLGELLQSDHLPTGVEEHPEGTCPICDWVGCLQDEWLNDRIVRGGTP